MHDLTAIETQEHYMDFFGLFFFLVLEEHRIN